MLELSHITKSYRKKPVLTDVSLTLKGPALISVIGPNGAGKSTLLSAATQLIAPDAGEVRLDGRPVTDFSRRSLARRIAMLRQTTALSLRLTVRELVGFGRFPYSGGHLTAHDREIVDGALGALSLTSYGDRFIDELSGGERQRALIAMVLAQDTDYILLDEPLNNLDMKHEVEIMRTLRTLVDVRRKTIVCVIHDINFASYYSDEIVALRGGRLIACGSVADVLTEELLEALYDMKISVRDEGGHRLCNYYGTAALSEDRQPGASCQFAANRRAGAR